MIIMLYIQSYKQTNVGAIILRLSLPKRFAKSRKSEAPPPLCVGFKWRGFGVISVANNNAHYLALIVIIN